MAQYEIRLNKTDMSIQLRKVSYEIKLQQTGRRGLPGAQGDPGDPGTAATIEVGTTTTLDPGSEATVVNVGNENDAIFNFGIPKGESGTGGGAVDSVNGQTGTVVLDKNDIGLGNVDNTSDSSKPVSTATQTELDKKVNITSAFNDGDLYVRFGVGVSGLSKADLAADSAFANAYDQNGAAATAESNANSYTDSEINALTKSDVGLGNVDNTSNATERAATATLTNKRITPRVFVTTSASTLVPEKDTYDCFSYTALAASLAINNHSTSTVSNFKKIEIRIVDNGTPRALTFDTNYVARGGIALPTTTVANKMMTLGFEWVSAISKYNLIALAQET